MTPLTHEEAIARAELIGVRSYDIDLDLTSLGPTFLVRTRIEFTCEAEGASTFVEHAADRTRSIRLNDASLDVDRVVARGRIALDGLRSDNVLVVESEGRYAASAEGLCRFRDPEDGEDYVFSHAFLDLAPRIFPCFDQPDLKATYDIAASVPAGWTARSNGRGREVEPGRWAFTTTPPLPTYVVGLVAGPWHVAEAEHDGTPLGLVCRRSMAPYLDADELFAVTIEALDRYRGLFGPYPFEKFDQVFCPSFGGGMENAALVTLGEDALFRARVTTAERRQRSELMFHELAHMWFGDCVTTRWWNDLWLNEAFATYVSVLALSQGAVGPAAWVDFAFMKEGGYREDQMPTTHPVSGVAADTADALLDFDGISYVKGASAIKQLAAWVGAEPFLAGVRRLIVEHRFGNVVLADLLEAIERESGRNLDEWADTWLCILGVDTLRLRAEVGDGGTYAAVAVERVPPPSGATLRPHRIAIGLFEAQGEELVRSEGIELEITGDLTEAPALVGRAADVTILDDLDLTWAKTRLDARSLARVLERGAWRIGDPLPRAHLWTILRDLVLDSELAVGPYLASVADGIERDADPTIAHVLVGHAFDAIRRLGDESQLRGRTAWVADRCLGALDGASPGGDRQLVVARGAIDGAIEPPHLERIRSWLEDRDVPAGLTLGPQERWRIVRRLAVTGGAVEGDIEAESARDPSATGLDQAEAARGSIATAEAKEAAWRVVFDPALAYTKRMVVAEGFGHAEQVRLTRPFVSRVIPDLESMWGREAPFAASVLSRAVLAALPVEARLVEEIDRGLASSAPPSGLRRILVEHRWELVRALGARALDAESYQG